LGDGGAKRLLASEVEVKEVSVREEGARGDRWSEGVSFDTMRGEKTTEGQDLPFEMAHLCKRCSESSGQVVVMIGHASEAHIGDVDGPIGPGFTVESKGGYIVMR
jgi:hypothetical protein